MSDGQQQQNGGVPIQALYATIGEQEVNRRILFEQLQAAQQRIAELEKPEDQLDAAGS